MELEQFMSRVDVTEESRRRQWEYWSNIATELGDEFGESEDEMTSGDEEEMTKEEDSQSRAILGVIDGGKTQVQTTWRHGNQSYHVKRWSTADGDKDIGTQPGKRDLVRRAGW